MTTYDTDGLMTPFWMNYIGKLVAVRTVIGARDEGNNTISLLHCYIGPPPDENDINQMTPNFPFRDHLWISNGKKWKKFESGETIWATARINSYQKHIKETDELIRKLTLSGFNLIQHFKRQI